MQHRRVLIVDDSQDICDALVYVVQTLGYEARAVLDGETALTVACEFQPHIVLLDLWLPGMNGYDVARKLREAPGGRDLLIVVVTGSDATVSESNSAGVDVHLHKPIGVATLRALFHFPDPDDVTGCARPRA